jgi:hypothetical protein
LAVEGAVVIGANFATSELTALDGALLPPLLPPLELLFELLDPQADRPTGSARATSGAANLSNLIDRISFLSL